MDLPPNDLHGDTVSTYASLDPQRVLDALERVNLYGDGRILQLNSYENRVFQVYLEDGGAVVAKFYRPARWSDAQILEEHAFAAELAQAEIPVIAPLTLTASTAAADTLRLMGQPPTLACLDEAGAHRFSVSPCRSGRAPELDDPATLRWIGRLLGRMHAVGAVRPFTHRLNLDVATFGDAARHILIEGRHLSADVEPAWTLACDAALDAVREAFDKLPNTRRIRLHGDCHRGNVLWTDAGPHFVDLDDEVNGPAVQDLWMLLSGDRQAMTRQLLDLLEGYEDFFEFDWRECALIEPLRTLRMIHHSAWIARRWTDPAFPAAFPWFGTGAYWSQQIHLLRDQVEAMQEAPLGSR